MINTFSTTILLFFVLLSDYLVGQKIKIILSATFIYPEDSIRVQFNNNLLFNQRITDIDFPTSTGWAKIIFIPKQIKLQDENVLRFDTYGFFKDEVIHVENQCLVIDKRLLKHGNIYFLIGSRTIEVVTRKQLNKKNLD